MEHIKLIDVSSPKATKDTINKLIDMYDGFEAKIQTKNWLFSPWSC